MKIKSSYHQQRLWFINHFEKDHLYDGNPIYHNVPLAISIKRQVSEVAVRNAFASLLRDHEILRTKLVVEEGSRICQKIVPIEEVDLAKLLVPTEDVFARAELLRSLPFDDGDFLLRGYYELSEQGCHLFLVLHHAIVDYHSVKKIRAFFLDALERDVAVPATKIVPYQRFSNWQNELGQDELEPLLFYWKAQLVDNPVLYFPTDHKREHIHVYKSQLLRTEISKDGMARFCDEQGGSIQVFLLAMYKMILSKFTALPDVVLGTVMPLRPESANVLLGPVDNLVVLRSSIDPHKTVAEHHREVMRTWEMAKKYKSMPFDKLVSEINPKKDRSRTALFDLLFQYDVVDSQMDEEEWEINSRNLGWGKYDLNLLVSEKEDSLLLSLTYNGLYFEAYTMKAFLTAYEKLIAESLQKPELLLEEFDLLTEEESQVLLSSQQGELSAFDRRASIPSLFRSQLLKHEDRTALVGSSFDPLSYKELDVLSNQLANLLQGTFGIQSGDKIAVTLPKTDELIIALLALLKLGATYVPMDAAHPEERKQFILSDSDCKLTIDRAFTNSWMGKAKEEKTSFDSREVDSDATAYIIYTSGTTGKPKGVRVSHRNVVALLHSCFEHIKVDAKDTWVQFHSHCFDFSVWEIFGCLLSGGQLLMVTPAEARDLDALCQLMNAQDATIFSQTPSAFYNFMAHESLTAPLRYVIFGGEMLLPNKLKEWHDKHPDVKLINMYGITETTVHVTLKELGPGDLNSELSNIGKPLSFAQLYILNEQRQLLPYGRVGEMYVAGHGVAQGYLNRPELDRERFLPDVYLARGRMYRTGDKARWLPNGELEFIGRVDRQVKIRGYRIELDEIENAIAQFSPSIQQVAVDLKTVNQEDVIVAYYASTEAMEKTDIRNFLQSQLPEYMLPAFFVALESMQLTSNGKVDRKALPEVNREDLLGREYVAPDNETEQQIAAIWQEVLGLKQLSATDDFFELGGHSLKIIMVKNRIRDVFQFDLDISDFFDHSILRDLAKFVDENSTTASTPLPALIHLPVAERYESSKAQKRLWFIHQLRKNRSAYNIDFALRVGGTFHQQAFQQAVDGMLERHEILRTIFPDAQQLITPPKRCDIDVRRKEPGTSVKETLLAIAALPFDLEKGPLFKVHILEESDQVRYILFNIHHIIFDDWSVAIFIKELLTSYEAFVHNTIPSLQPIVYQYKAYAHWKNEMAKSDLYKASELYWLARFDELPQALELPCDFPRPKRKTFRGNNLFRELEQDLVEEIQTKIGADRLSSVSFFLACFKLLLYKYSHQSDLVVGMPVSDRDHRALENQIGLYLNVIAVRSNLQPSLSLKEALQQEHQSLLEALNHKLYPLDELVEKLVLPRDVSRSPLFDVMFAHQYENDIGFEQGEWNLGNLQLEKIQLNPPTSKFDLLLNMVETKDRFRLRLSYNSDLFEESSAKQMMDHLLAILRLCSGDGSKLVNQISVLSEQEKVVLYPRKEQAEISHISSLLNRQLEQSPNALTIRCGDETYSLARCHQLADNMATNLSQRYDVGRGDRIAVYADAPVVYPLMFLALSKLGACYLPLDDRTPQKRRAFILQESKPKLLVLDGPQKDDFSACQTANYQDLQRVPTDKMIFGESSLEDESFIVYTSGTTGRPKGIIHPYRTISNLIEWQKENLTVRPAEGYLQFASFTFDASIQDIAFCLASGLTIHLPSKEERRDFDKLFDYILQNNISIVSLPFSVLRSFITVIDLDRLNALGLRHIITYGEQLVVAKKFAAFLQSNPHIQVHNYYGPSETHVITTNTFSGEMPLEEFQNIGRPIANNHAYLLDEDGRLVPRGVVGTLYISGANVFDGYVDEELPSRKYDIFSEYQDGPLYNTGDLARWRADGKLQYLGRKDQQIKIDGNRIEVREIERVLGRFDGIQEAVILCLKKADGYALHGFYVSEMPLKEADIKSFLASHLPSYMIPQSISALPSLPTNKNGKVDKRILESKVPTSTGLPEAELGEAQLSALGKKVKSLWEKNLHLSIASLQSDYFELGGHSLSAMVLLNQLRETFHCDMDIEDVFEHRRLSDMIHFVENASLSSLSIIPRAEQADSYPLSPAQLGFWLKIQHQTDKEAHNIAMSFVAKGVLHLEALNEALRQVVASHEVLRTVFPSIQGESRQQILDADDLQYEIKLDRNHLPEYSWEELLWLDASFSIDRWPLFHFGIVEVEENTRLVLIEIHHLISDGWSIELFVQELLQRYRAIVCGEEWEKQSRRIQYKDYAVWMNDSKNSGAYWEAASYWKEKLSNVVYQDSLKSYRTEETTRSLDGSNCIFEIPKNNALLSFAAGHELSLYAVVVSALFLLKYQYSRKTDLLIASVSAGRVHKELEDMMGYFLHSYFLRVQLNHQMVLEEWMQQVKQGILKALKHHLYPLEEMMDLINDEKRLIQGRSIYELGVTYQTSVFHREHELDRSDLSQLDIRPHRSKVVKAKDPLWWYFTEHDQKIVVDIHFQTAIYEEAAIAKLFNDFTDVLDQMTQATSGTSLDALTKLQSDSFADIEESAYREMSSDF